jgi:hypothetical protein
MMSIITRGGEYGRKGGVRGVDVPHLLRHTLHLLHHRYNQLTMDQAAVACTKMVQLL